MEQYLLFDIVRILNGYVVTKHCSNYCRFLSDELSSAINNI